MSVRSSWSGARSSLGQGTRAAILRRDGGRCYLCGAPAGTVDHLLNAARGGTDDPANLAAICDPCHAAKTAQEQAVGRQNRGQAARTPERHPGSL